MTQAEILRELKLQPTKNFKQYAGRILGLLNLINVLEKLPGFKVNLGDLKDNVDMVKSLPKLNWVDSKGYESRNNLIEIIGEFGHWQQIDIIHASGRYSVPFPAGNKFYNVLAGMAGEDVKKEPVASVRISETVTVGSEIFTSLSRAVKFIGRDDSRPVMQHICIAIENKTVEIVATDAHKLFRSQKAYASKKKRIEILINEVDAKVLAKMKFDTDQTEIHLLKDTRIMIGGKIFDTFTDAKYMQYRVVIPEYELYMEFNRKDFISGVKSVMQYANKSTCQVNFHLNGEILMTAQDVDFSFEGKQRMVFINKQFPEMEIAFNGRFLVECLGIFKEPTTKFFTNGKPSNAGIFTNGKDTILLMPLIIHN